MSYHEPVLLHECMEGLSIKPNGIYVDVTFGGGGHANEILKHLTNGKLYGFDQDPDAMANTIKDQRFTMIQQNFRHLKKYLKFYNALPVDGILADLGISSHQINIPERGFSTRFEAELDMRMNKNASITAKEIINNYSEAELVRIFSEYGEVHNSRRLAKTLVDARNKKTHQQNK